MDDIIITKNVFIPQTTNMLHKNVTFDEKLQYFATPRTQNKINTVPIAQVLLVSDPMQRQHNTTTYMTHQKQPPYGMEYLCFKIDVNVSWEAQC